MNDLLKEILKGRIEELKEEIKKFTALELDATCKKDVIYYGYRVAEARQTLATVKEAQYLNNTFKEFFKC
ncbi:hypothetical protein EXM65_15475 [Clostridium botulinum]|uniref:Uncharacterized protein n=1 Tax=Clostridium botulinum TaxID=1491 RepID=A0A6M0ST29_CLOBO|nr:hypothetical protein [Clostridium botulinum]